MSAQIKPSSVDAALDSVDDDASPATALADMLDDREAWDEDDGGDRVAILESSGAWWLVCRGAEGDSADRYATKDDARRALTATVSR